MLEIIGWIGATLFALCAVPQSYHSWKTGRSDGLSLLFLGMWFLGEVLTLIYTVIKAPDALPLIGNYMMNMGLLCVILKYKFWPRS